MQEASRFRRYQRKVVRSENEIDHKRQRDQREQPFTHRSSAFVCEAEECVNKVKSAPKWEDASLSCLY